MLALTHKAKYKKYSTIVTNSNGMKCPLTICKPTEDELSRHSIFLFIKYFIQMKRALINFKNTFTIRECLKFLMRERVKRVVTYVLNFIITLLLINY